MALSLSSGSEGKFTVDAITGEIRTTPSSLDREEKSVYRMTVVATDPGDRQVAYLFIYDTFLLIHFLFQEIRKLFLLLKRLDLFALTFRP